MRATVVAAIAAALGLLALASLSPTAERPYASLAPSFRAPAAAQVVYTHEPLAVVSRADSVNR